MSKGSFPFFSFLAIIFFSSLEGCRWEADLEVLDLDAVDGGLAKVLDGQLVGAGPEGAGIQRVLLHGSKEEEEEEIKEKIKNTQFPSLIVSDLGGAVLLAREVGRDKHLLVDAVQRHDDLAAAVKARLRTMKE
jgi:hypothetical protein